MTLKYSNYVTIAGFATLCKWLVWWHGLLSFKMSKIKKHLSTIELWVRSVLLHTFHFSHGILFQVTWRSLATIDWCFFYQGQTENLEDVEEEAGLRSDEDENNEYELTDKESD